ncbi:MAG: ribonuclease HII [Bacteroidota bacterium]
MLKKFHTENIIEAGVDEAGRGCLAGPVFAAAVILPKDYHNSLLNDSKKLSKNNRYALRDEIIREAVSYAVASVSETDIDKLNILQASIRAMHKTISKLTTKPGLLLIDGNRFIPFEDIPHHCIVKGDGLYYSIAAASVLAKTYRDDHMISLHETFPEYGWNQNMGYATRKHIEAIEKHGFSPHHRKSFHLKKQIKLPFS